MKWLAIIISALLVGCGTTASTEFPERTSYIMVSKGEASLVYKALVGGVDYCKATQHNLEGVEFVGSIEYDGETCTVLLEAENGDRVQ